MYSLFLYLMITKWINLQFLEKYQIFLKFPEKSEKYLLNSNILNISMIFIIKRLLLDLKCNVFEIRLTIYCSCILILQYVLMHLIYYFRKCEQIFLTHSFSIDKLLKWGWIVILYQINSFKFNYWIKHLQYSNSNFWRLKL